MMRWLTMTAALLLAALPVAAQPPAEAPWAEGKLGTVVSDLDKERHAELIPIVRRFLPSFQLDENHSGLTVAPDGEDGDSLWLELRATKSGDGFRLIGISASVHVAEESGVARFDPYLNSILGVRASTLLNLQPYRPAALAAEGVPSAFVSGELMVGPAVNGRNYWIHFLPRSMAVEFRRGESGGKDWFMGFGAIRKALQAPDLRGATRALGGVGQIQMVGPWNDQVLYSIAWGPDNRPGREEWVSLWYRINPLTLQPVPEEWSVSALRPHFAAVMTFLNKGVKPPGKLVWQGKPYRNGGPKAKATLKGFPVNGLVVLDCKKSFKATRAYIRITLPRRPPVLPAVTGAGAAVKTLIEVESLAGLSVRKVSAILGRGQKVDESRDAGGTYLGYRYRVKGLQRVEVDLWRTPALGACSSSPPRDLRRPGLRCRG